VRVHDAFFSSTIFSSSGRFAMIHPPQEMGNFEFVAIAALRAAQLTRGCRPRVEGVHTTAVLAQREVAEGRVTRTDDTPPQPLGAAHDKA